MQKIDIKIVLKAEEIVKAECNHQNKELTKEAYIDEIYQTYLTMKSEYDSIRSKVPPGIFKYRYENELKDI